MRKSLLGMGMALSGLALTWDRPKDWCTHQLVKLSKTEQEKAIRLFNGDDLEDWRGDSQYWSVKNNVIVAENGWDNPPHFSTYLLTNGV